MHGMVAIADRAQTIPFTPAPRARGQRERSGWSQNFCSNPSGKRPFERPSASQQSRLGSCSRDPIGYVAGPSPYTYVLGMPVVSVDPYGLQLLVPRPIMPRPVPVQPFPRIYVPPPRPFIPPPPIPGPVPLPIGGPDPRPMPEQEPVDQPYPGDNMDPPGDCGQAQYDLLRNDILNKCKSGELTSCRDGWLPWRCNSYKDMANKFSACADARRRLNQACFRGGDRGHQISEMQMRNAAQWCWYYYRRCQPRCEPPQMASVAPSITISSTSVSMRTFSNEL
jgi:hypothetical protein